ncbi:LCP family protein [Candidatus Woesebacteria bacterium]|nr:LCP family protein [Candidatus Woesebacteria bacterium]
MEDIKSEPKVVRRVKNVRSKNLVLLSRIRRRLFKHVWLVRIGLLLAIFGAFVGLLFVAVLVFNALGFSKYTRYLGAFLLTPRDKIEMADGRTNILILGKAGEGNEAPNLTDTIIFASISHENKGMTLVSLPRDVWIPELRAKLNSAYYWGNQKQPPARRAYGPEGGGLILAKATVEEIVGEPVHYALIIDLSSLKKVVDILDGIEVEVENSFVDEKYPIVGREGDLCGGDVELKCRYETVKFEKGLQTMDGGTALKFVRSRNAEGDEGTDTARAARQQQVLDAIEKKISTSEILLNPSKIKGLIELFNKVVETDIGDEAGVILFRRLLESRNKRSSVVLGEEFLDNPPISKKYDYLYVFVPKEDNWTKVHEWVDNLLKD